MSAPSSFHASSLPRAEPAQAASPREPGGGSLLWSLITWALVVSCLVAGAVVVVTVGGLAALLGDKRRAVASRILQGSFNAITTLHPRYKITVTGKENLPPPPYILCPNHQSYSDVVYLFSLREHFKWVVKHELFFVPLFGPAMWIARYPRIRRGDLSHAQRLMHKVQTLLRQGVSVLVFPEGSRSPSGQLQPFQRGAARMAVAGQVPLVPVGVTGTARLLPKGSAAYPARAHIWIHVGEPISVAGKAMNRRDLRVLTETLRQGVIAAKAVGEEGVRQAGGPLTP